MQDLGGIYRQPIPTACLAWAMHANVKLLAALTTATRFLTTAWVIG